MPKVKKYNNIYFIVLYTYLKCYIDSLFLKELCMKCSGTVYVLKILHVDFEKGDKEPILYYTPTLFNLILLNFFF